jgi:hypothetical protein
MSLYRADEHLNTGKWAGAPAATYWGSTDAEGASVYLTDMGYHFSPHALTTLRQLGRGPTSSGEPLNSLRYWPDDVIRYLQYLRGTDAMMMSVDQDTANDHVRRPEGTAPRWLISDYAHPNSTRLCEQIESWGGEAIGPYWTSSYTLSSAANGDIDAAILSMDYNFEVAIASADLLVERGIPFLFLTQVQEVPRFIHLHGNILPMPIGLEEIALAIASRMPDSVVERMNLPKMAKLADHRE